MKLDKMAEKLGFQLKSGVFTRTYGGYEINLISYKMPGAYVAIPMVLIVFSKTIDQDTFKKLGKVSGMRVFIKESVALKDNAILAYPGFKNQDKFDDFLDQKTKIFKEIGLGQFNYCPYCGKEDTDSTRVIKGALIHVHDECVKDFIQKVNTHLNTVGNSKEHLLKSIVYAIIGGIIGLIPSIIILMVIGIYSAWLFILIPFAAFYGYKKGGAQRGSYVMIIIAVISLILAPSFMLFVYYDISVYYEVPFQEMLINPEFSAAFLQDMILSVVFTLIALWASWKSIFKQTHGQIKKDIQELDS